MEGLWSTVIICGILVLIGIVAVRSYLKKLKNGCCGGGDNEVKKIRPSDREESHFPYEYKIQVEGMSCKNCALRIENAFHMQEGFLAAVYFKEKYALVRSKQPVSEEKLKETVFKAGYGVLGISQIRG